ncbi:hypothetical protein [Actinophytocola oryzae]|uniref:Uncharacterized protein n=1 Tax=Actinophytocola oryzae TaxID=502181 RepID=A0A4V3FU54_9PSEU|nr:hypothetical protein [Actinophytocola oryzae]TDV53911.1 hypothetical protein CLV71_104379 [Actinophytocola oryzae]
MAMRAVLLVLLLVVAGCATERPGTPSADDTVMPADFAGSVTYANGTVAPPYHYEWRLTFDDTTAAIEWTPGYDRSTTPWRETVDITADQRATLFGVLRDLGVFDLDAAGDDGMVGGPTGGVEVTSDGRTYDPGTLGLSKDSATLLDGVVDAVHDLAPAEVWDGLEDKQDDWSARQPK